LGSGGVYSGFGSGSGNRTFMRGIQRTDGNGLARFRTVYPGWYRGRTVHIHVKVHIAGNVVHTGQLYFPDSWSDRVFRRKPYSRRPSRDTRNAADSVFRNGGKRSLLSLRTSAGLYVGTIRMGVQR
jgi:protocatechuate 3,4-dioxygenase beta subunit